MRTCRGAWVRFILGRRPSDQPQQLLDYPGDIGDDNAHHPPRLVWSVAFSIGTRLCWRKWRRRWMWCLEDGSCWVWVQVEASMITRHLASPGGLSKSGWCSWKMESNCSAFSGLARRDLSRAAPMAQWKVADSLDQCSREGHRFSLVGTVSTTSCVRWLVWPICATLALT